MDAWGRELMVELYKRYAPDVERLLRFDAFIPTIGKSYAGEERRLLYLMTRFIEPELIIEFSPKRGWTTLHMAAALEDNHKGRIISFELDPIYAALTKRTVKTARLAHRVEVVVGDVREEFPRVYGDPGTWRSAPEIGFLFVDSDHGAEFAHWYLGNLFPLVRQNGVIHAHDIEASPERVVNQEPLPLEPTGEEKVLAEHLVRHRDRYRWFSVADAVRDRAYLAAVRPWGGGDLSFPPGRVRLHPTEKRMGFERNPSLWILQTGAQESKTYPDRPFEPLHRTLKQRLAYETRKQIASFYAPLRERRRMRRVPTPGGLEKR